MIVTEVGNRILRIEEEKVMEVLSVTSKNSFLEKSNLSLCHQDKSESKFNKKINRSITEKWLKRKIENLDLKFHYFITLSFYKGTKSPITQYLDNQHIKKVILDFFYPNKKPKDRIRIWFFIEKHKTGRLHLHLLMEGINGLEWLKKNNRKITLQKKTLFDIIANDFSMDDLITESLINHLKKYIFKLGKGKQSTDVKYIGDFEKRVNYLNKSISNFDFDGWQHIDFENSDFN